MAVCTSESTNPSDVLKKYTLTLSWAEAQTLADVLGRIGGDLTSTMNKYAQSTRQALLTQGLAYFSSFSRYQHVDPHYIGNIVYNMQSIDILKEEAKKQGIIFDG